RSLPSADRTVPPVGASHPYRWIRRVRELRWGVTWTRPRGSVLDEPAALLGLMVDVALAGDGSTRAAHPSLRRSMPRKTAGLSPRSPATPPTPPTPRL